MEKKIGTERSDATPVGCQSVENHGENAAGRIGSGQ